MTAWSSGRFQRGGVNLHYVRTGGSKPAFVLLHGLTGNGACWTPLAQAFQSEFDVVMPDARGHGNSIAPLHGYRYEDHAMDVIALIRHLALVAPVVLGHSMGGMTAALVAHKMGRDIGSVILADPTFISPQWQRDVRDSDVADVHRHTLSLDKAAVVASQIQARHPHRSPEIVELLAQARLQTRMSAFDVLTPPNPDYERLVREIQVPMLLVIADGVVSFDTARALQNVNPRVRIEQIADAGHGIPFDQPERFEAAVRSCLD